MVSDTIQKVRVSTPRPEFNPSVFMQPRIVPENKIFSLPSFNVLTRRFERALAASGMIPGVSS